MMHSPNFFQYDSDASDKLRWLLQVINIFFKALHNMVKYNTDNSLFNRCQTFVAHFSLLSWLTGTLKGMLELRSQDKSYL